MRIKIAVAFLKKIFLGWSCTIITFLIYIFLISNPLCNISLFKNTFFAHMIAFPVFSVFYLGIFLLIYTALKYEDYVKVKFAKNLMFHLVLYILFYILIRGIEGGYEDFNLNRLFDYSYMLFGMVIYFTLHILIFNWISGKFEKYIIP